MYAALKTCFSKTWTSCSLGGGGDIWLLYRYIKDWLWTLFHVSFFPTENGELYTFGESDDGKLGLGDDTDESNTPQHVMSITDRVKAVSCGGSHTVALTGNQTRLHTSAWHVLYRYRCWLHVGTHKYYSFYCEVTSLCIFGGQSILAVCCQTVSVF